MSRFLRALCLTLAVVTAFSVTSCKKEEAAVQDTSLKVPSTDRDEEWKAYVQAVAKSKRVVGKTKNTYVRFLGATEDPAPHLRDTTRIFQVGAQAGTLIVFGSQNSRNMSDLLEQSLTAEGVDGRLMGVRIVFVGRKEDEARLQAAAPKSGATLEFVAID